MRPSPAPAVGRQLALPWPLTAPADAIVPLDVSLPAGMGLYQAGYSYLIVLFGPGSGPHHD